MKKCAALFLIISLWAAAAAQSGRTRPRQVETETAPAPAATIAVEPAAPAPAAKTSAAPGAAANDDDVLKVETALVTIPVSVLDRTGRFVSGLRQQNFKIFENGKAQEIGYFGAADQPLTVVLLLDTSPSTELRINDIQTAAISFVNQLKPNDQVMVIEFDANLHVLSEATGDRARLQKAIRKADFGGGTSLHDTLDNVLRKRLPKIKGRKAIVMFTDGVDTTSYKSVGELNIEDAERAETPIYAVYYDTINDNSRVANVDPSDTDALRGTTPAEYEAGRNFLQAITGKTGGRVYAATTATNLETAFNEIAGELRQQYSIGYYPSEAGKSGERKTVKVELVNVPDATIRARESYVVGGEKQEIGNRK